MKFECSSEKLKNALIKAERITAKNPSLPILDSLLLIASNKVIRIRSTNLSLGIEIEIPANIIKEGVVAVRGDIFSNIFSNLPKDEKIKIELINDNLSINTTNSSTLIKSYPSDDFPTIPKITENSFNIESEKIINGIKSVYYSASLSDIKPEFASIYIHTEVDNIIFTATDSFRLAEKKIKLKNQINIQGILIPFKNIIEIIKLFSDVVGGMKICFNQNQISFSIDNIYLTSNLINGLFPDYKQIIPKNFTTEIIILKKDLLNALKIVNIFSDKFNQISLTASPKNKKLELYSKNSDFGENKTKINAVLEGEDVDLNFNYKYFLDCFQSINSDSLVLKLNESNKPMVITGVPDESFIYLIMPMNR